MHWIRGETLGKGGFGFVSKATTHHHPSAGAHHHHHLPSLIAVKSSTLSESASLVKEKQLLDKFQGCPSILPCFGDDITSENGQKLYNILLEYASGGCLADRIIPAKGLPEKVVGRCANSILAALVHIHRLGYVHCDVKPHNVLLVGGGNNNYENAKLADFGSCKRRNEQQTDFVGTVIYAAPESIARQEYLPESDVWALGCSVLHMLTGKPPWVFDKRAEAKDVLFKIGCSDQIPVIPPSNKISKEAKDFLNKCLVKDPSARWKAEMLLNHPFLVKSSNSSSSSIPVDAPRNCRVPLKLSRGIHSLVPHCFHVPKVHAAF
ncbi:mitogen-activated protein kinase kinase kinase 21 [Striga hermonthica]|uniref:Mitogen-activated protein kinase kinase kinase 21 n=1 Tax=Striga hermonthica TaxID=68872 RepID=A0A9N7NSI0_STRHE|nr:mitogen-activated protein kinase kinase kinase 21 [Striga hermonthica]